jgi:hypothetical protein
MKNTIVTFLLLALVFSCCKNNSDQVSDNLTSSTQNKIHTIYYIVNGTANSADVTCTFPTLNKNVTYSNVKIPWSMSVDAKSGQSFTLVAHGKQSDTGYLTGYISIDGKEYSSMQSNNPNAVIVLSGNVP